jgi:hypothetical protein
MPRKLSDQYENIAWFFEGISSHLKDNSGIFLGGAELKPREKAIVQNKLDALVEEYRENALLYRSAGR